MLFDYAANEKKCTPYIPPVKQRQYFGCLSGRVKYKRDKLFSGSRTAYYVVPPWICTYWFGTRQDREVLPKPTKNEKEIFLS